MENTKKENMETAKKEELKKEESAVQTNLINENSSEEVKETTRRYLKNFSLISTTTEAGKDYSNIEVYSYKGNSAKIRLSEAQAQLVKEIGVDNCYVNIESRYSEKARKYYDVIALHISDFETFDLFARDRGFCSLAKLQAKKYFGEM